MPRQNRGHYLKLQRSGVWAIAWSDPGSRVVRTRSTGEADRGRAEEALARYLAALEQHHDPAAATVREMAEAYMVHLKATSRHWTKHRASLRAVVRHLGWLSYQELSARHADSYARARTAEGKACGTVAQELTMFRMAVKRHGEAHDLPLIRWPKISRPPPRERWLSREEGDRLVAACVSPHVRLFVLLALHTGARSEAILTLRWSQVDLELAVVHYGTGTANKARAVVPVNDTLLAALKEARSAAVSPFVVEYAGGAITRINRTVSKAAARAGIAHMSPHDLRRTAGSWMLQAGVRLSVVSRVLGHKSEATTERVYARLRLDDLREAVAKLG